MHALPFVTPPQISTSIKGRNTRMTSVIISTDANKREQVASYLIESLVVIIEI